MQIKDEIDSLAEITEGLITLVIEQNIQFSKILEELQQVTVHLPDSNVLHILGSELTDLKLRIQELRKHRFGLQNSDSGRSSESS